MIIIHKPAWKRRETAGICGEFGGTCMAIDNWLLANWHAQWIHLHRERENAFSTFIFFNIFFHYCTWFSLASFSLAFTQRTL